MKNLIFTFVIVLLVGPIYTQSNYYPLIETGKTWHVVEGGFGAFFITYTYKLEGDTLINQENFKFLYRSNEEFPVNWEKYGYIREDENKKVYYSAFDGNGTTLSEPAMVYDFGVEVDDTITITSFAYNSPNELEIIISEIDSILIDDDYRRRIKYTCGEWSYDDNFWIEGIGSNNGLLEPGFYCYIVCPTIDLLCVKEGDNIIYHSQYYEECYMVGVDENNVGEQQFSVNPNPAKDNIYITSKTHAGAGFIFILYDLKSEVVFQKKIKDFNQSVISTNKLKDGLYLYRIIENDELKQNGKIIINK